MAFLPEEALQAVGFKFLGRNVLVSDKASIHNPGAVSIEGHTRIDDFCVISPSGDAQIRIGPYVHIACHSALIGRADIVLEEFSNISSRVNVYSSSDDFSGAFMTNPMVPDVFTHVTHRPVRVCRHVVVGCGSVVLPGVVLAEGCAIGALSLVRESTEPFGIYGGAPARRLKDRSRQFLIHEQQFRARPGTD
jgi:galactoside O-acetyltransferase